MHVRVDERSAGFLALGLAKVSRRPAVIITTSGTAVANLHPAVLEAHHAQVPMIVLSADRPPELRGTGANQTTVQPGLFGSSIRWSGELGTPEGRDGEDASWRSTAARAWVGAMGIFTGHPGPVHLNVPFRDPLTPPLPGADDVEGKESAGARETSSPKVAVFEHPADRWATGSPLTLDERDTIAVIGDLPDDEARERALRWVRANRLPTVTEPMGDLAGPSDSPDTVLPHGSMILTATRWLDAHAPQRVIVIGRPTLTRSVGALLRRPGLDVDVVTAEPEWTDPGHVATAVHPIRALQTEGKRELTPFASAWVDAGEQIARALTANETIVTGPAIARAVSEAMPKGSTLFLGSSSAARDHHLGVARTPVGSRVIASRGLAGIDGCVSTAVGLALSDPDTPTYALVGDLTFVHDSGGLTIGPGEPTPDLTIVVVDDHGGGIFATLEYGEPERAAHFDRVFATPSGVDIETLCRAHGYPCATVEGLDVLAREIAAPPRGLKILRIPLDLSGRRAVSEDSRGKVAGALSAS